MRDIKFRVWYLPEKKMYYRGYQKLTHILLCDNDQKEGIPVKRVPYKDCEMLECTDIEDIHGRLIYEGDLVQIHWENKNYFGEVGEIPDMFRSRGLHPIHGLLHQFKIPDDAKNLSFEIMGNTYENPSLSKTMREIRHDL